MNSHCPCWDTSLQWTGASVRLATIDTVVDADPLYATPWLLPNATAQTIPTTRQLHLDTLHCPRHDHPYNPLLRVDRNNCDFDTKASYCLNLALLHLLVPSVPLPVQSLPIVLLWF